MKQLSRRFFIRFASVLLLGVLGALLGRKGVFGLRSRSKLNEIGSTLIPEASSSEVVGLLAQEYRKKRHEPLPTLGEITSNWSLGYYRRVPTHQSFSAQGWVVPNREAELWAVIVTEP